jgi:hypothetical protein
MKRYFIIYSLIIIVILYLISSSIAQKSKADIDDLQFNNMLEQLNVTANRNFNLQKKAEKKANDIVKNAEQTIVGLKAEVNKLKSELNEVKNKFNKDKFTPPSTKVEEPISVKGATETTTTETKIAPEASTAESESMFNEATEIGNIKKPSEKREAQKAFEEKHGVPQQKVSDINRNFESITDKLRKKGLIEIDC